FGGASGSGLVTFTNLDRRTFGRSVHALVQEIPWTGQLGDSAQPRVVAELTVPVTGTTAGFDFGGTLPELTASSAYQITLTPSRNASSPAVSPTLWTSS